MRGIWARSTACLVFSSLAFVLGGAQLLAVVELSYGTQTTRGWVASSFPVRPCASTAASCPWAWRPAWASTRTRF